MDTTQSQLIRASVLEFWGRFASIDMEERFRIENLPEDAETASFLAFIYALTTVMFFFTDWVLRGVTPTFLILIVPRLMIVLSSATLIVRLRRAIAPSWFDGWLLGYFSLNLFMELLVHFTRSVSDVALSSLLFIWALSSLVPMRFLYQMACAILTALAFTGLIIAKQPDSGFLTKVLIASVSALVIGLVCSRRVQRSRRQTFAARLQERETGVLLEAALAEIKTLEGILPICASCKKIREEDGSWTPLDEFVSDHTEASFSHGMCPECMPKFFPNRSPQGRES